MSIMFKSNNGGEPDDLMKFCEDEHIQHNKMFVIWGKKRKKAIFVGKGRTILSICGHLHFCKHFSGKNS